MTILFIWAVLASDRGATYAGWRALAEFETVARCEDAAKALALDARNYRCVRK